MEKDEDIKGDVKSGSKAFHWKTSYARLIKYWPILILALMGLLLLGVYATKSMLRFSMKTPIAFILPEDSITAPEPPSRLDSYKKEIEEIKKETARRRLALDRIIGMDFGKLGQDVKSGSHDATLLERNRERDLPAQGKAREEIDVGNNEEKQENQESRLLFTQRTGVTAHLDPQKNKPSKKAKQRPSEMIKDVQNEDANFFVVRPKQLTIQPDDSVSGTEPHFLKAVVNGNQKLTGNSTINLRITEAFTVNGKKFPRNTLVYGRVSGGAGGRLKVKISSVFSTPVQMVVLDQDFMQGIAYEYDEPVGDAIAESGNDALDEILYSIPYGGVASGIADLGRNITRKTRKVKPVFLADGYPLYVAFEK